MQEGENMKLYWILHMRHFIWVFFLVFLCFSYSTIYTMFPVFSLVLDKDVKSEVAMLYPELYKDLLKVFCDCYETICIILYKDIQEIW